MADLASLKIAVDSRQVVQAEKDLNKLGQASNRAEGAADNLANTSSRLGNVLAGLGIGFGVTELIRMADAFTSLQSKIRLVTDSQAELEAVQSRLFTIAQESRTQFEATGELYARLARSADALGASQDQVLQVTEAINKATVVSGATATEANAAIIQLSQGFQSGTLRGEELNSVLEQTPRVAQMIADGMGISVGQLRAFGAQGKLTSDQVFNALLRMSGGVDEEFAQMDATVGQSITVLRNAVVNLVGSFNNATGITSGLASVIVTLANNIHLVAAAAGVLLVRFVALKAAMAVAPVVAYMRSMIALERALGATSTRMALFSAATKMAQGAMRALTATMLVNPFVAVATAISGLIALLYSYRDSNIVVGNETIRFGDIFLGVWEGIKRGISFVQRLFSNGWAEAFAFVSPALRGVGEFFGNVFSYIGNIVRNYINVWVGLFVGLGRAIRAIFTTDSVGDAFRSGLGVDYVGAFGNAVGGAIVGLANLGRSARTASADTVDLRRSTEGLTRTTSGLTEATDRQRAADDAAAREREQAIQSAREYIDSLRQATQEIGKNEIQLKEMEIATRAAAAPTAELAEQTRRYGAALIEAMRGDAIGEAQRELGNLNRELRHQIGLIGLSADQRDAAIRAFEDEATVAEYAARGITRGNEALEEYLRLRNELAQGESAFAREAADIERLSNNLQIAAGMFGQSRIGSVLQGALNLEVKFADGETRKLSDAIASTFPRMAEVIGQAVSGAQIGQQVGNLMSAVGIKSSNTGSQLGGAVGMMVGGPIGAIGGAILGGLVGGMFKGTRRAAATIEIVGSNALMQGVRGSKQLQGVATGLANGLIKGLGDVASALGGELGGAVRLSIGQRKDKFTVDLSGQGRTKGVPTFNTEAEAIAFAMRNAIAQGAITGISAGAQALIRANGDLNEQIQKALSFDKVFDELLKQRDPLQAALNELGLEMQRLSKIFDEAGASAEERAQLEELFSIRRERAVFEANRNRRELEIELLEAQGRASEALAASRALELEAMDANLRGLKQQIFAAEDAAAANRQLADAQEQAARQLAAAQEQAARLAEARTSLEIELLEALGDTNGALALRRQLEIEATDVTLRGLQRQIFAAQDAAAAQQQAAAAQEAAQQRLAAAQDTLRQAYERESSTLIQTAQRFRALGDALRSVSGSISGMISGGAAATDLRGAFFRTAAAARLGDVAALEALPNLATELAQSVTETAPDRLTMIRELMAIRKETDLAALVTDRQASIAEQQLQVMTEQTTKLIDLEKAMITVAEATRQLVALNGGTPTPIGSTASVQQAAVYNPNQSPLMANNDNMRNEISALRDEMKVALFQIAKNTGKASDQLTRWDGEGLPEARGY